MLKTVGLDFYGETTTVVTETIIGILRISENNLLFLHLKSIKFPNQRTNWMILEETIFYTCKVFERDSDRINSVSSYGRT